MSELHAFDIRLATLDDVTDPVGRTFRAFADQTRSDLRALAACLRGSRRLMTRDEAASIKVPVLIAVGTKDEIAGSAAALGKIIAGAKVLDIPDRDHMRAVGDKVYKQAVLDLDNAERNVLVSQHQLAQFIGIKLLHPIVASGELVTRKAPASPEFDKLAVQTPTHFQQISNTEAARAGITIARSGILPSVTTNVSAERDHPAAGSWSAGITVSIPIFDGGKTYFNVKAADASLRQSLANLQSSDALTVYTLVQTHATLVGDIEAVSANQAALDAQKVRSEISKGQYSDGLISFTDFNLIENDLVTGQKNELQSRRDALIAEANWEYAQGKGAIP